jgi:hypothetical protein
VDNEGAISFGLASPYPALPNFALVGVIDPILGADPISASPVNSYFSNTGDTGPRHPTTLSTFDGMRFGA